MFTTHEVPGEDALTELITELLLDGECVAFINHTHDQRYLLFQNREHDAALLGEYSSLHLALTVAKMVCR